MKNSAQKEIIIFPIHLKTPYHYLSVGEFVEISQNIETILHTLNSVLFNGNLKIEVFVVPPKEGSFYGQFWVVSIALLAGAWAGLESDIWKAFVKWLTGNEPAYYAENAGKYARELFVLTESTKWFLEKDTLQLQHLWLQKNFLKWALRSKNKFYETCLSNLDIEAIWFTADEDFPVQRRDFPAKIANIIDSNDDSVPPVYMLHELIIISPVNTRDSTARWHTKDKTSGKQLSFYLRDESFFENFLAGKYPLKQTVSDDIIVVLIEYQKKDIDGEIRTIARNAVKIFSINDKQIQPIPNDLTVDIIQNDEKVESAQIALF